MSRNRSRCPAAIGGFKAASPPLQAALLCLGLMIGAMAAMLPARAAETAGLTLEAKIPLGPVVGRMDHLAFDSRRQRVYIAELGNDSVGVVGLGTRRLIRTITGFSEPQGIAYEPTTDTVYVANGGDGTVRVIRAADFSLLSTIKLGADADNVRIDPVANRVYVGYGAGALAVIDPAQHRKIAAIPLAGHPESFGLDAVGRSIFANVPDANVIAVVGLDTGKQRASWPTGSLRANFPLALIPDTERLVVVFRHPARLQILDASSGRVTGEVAVCGDSDDVFFDAKRQRLYVICGEGFVDVVDSNQQSRVSRFRSSDGTRTGLFVPELDRLFIAVRGTGAESAALWVLRPEDPQQ